MTDKLRQLTEPDILGEDTTSIGKDQQAHPLQPVDTRKIWDQTVGSYLEADATINDEINFPAIMRGLGDVQGLTVLDYGCGNGRLTRRLEALGATRAIGVDISSTMIDLANTADSNSRLEYHVNPDNTLFFLPDGSVDKVMANLVFMMSPSKEEMQQSFREIHRVLKDGGTFVFLVTHSAFIERGAHDYRNEFDGRFNYFAEEKPYKFILIDAQGEEIDEDFYDYHYTLATYLNTTIQAGFTISGVEEVSYPDDVAAKLQISPEFQAFPQALVVVGKKRVPVNYNVGQ